jgi:ATP-binding cassette subfamily A (ABC1) protein 3
MSLLKEFIASTFADAQLREEHRNVLHYQLTSSGASLAQIFHQLELARDLYEIEDYSVSQTTLDQVRP